MRRLLAVTAAIAVLSPAWADTMQTWMTIRLDGRKVGRAESVRTVEADRVTTSQTLDLRLARGKQPYLAHSDITVVESPGGKPLSFLALTKSSSQENRAEGTARENGTFQLATTVGGQQKIDMMMWPTGAMLSEGQRLSMVRHGFRPGTTYAMPGFDAVRQRAVNLDITVLGDEVVDMPGGPETLHHLRQSLAANPSAQGMDAWVDDEGLVRRSMTPLLGFHMEMTVCDRACAHAPDQDLDVLRTAMVQSPRLITASMRNEPMRYTLSYRGKDASPFIETSEQHVTALGDGLYEMLVTAPHVRKDALPPTPADLAPNAWVQSTAPEIVALAKEAVGNATTDIQRMRRLRSFVTDYITHQGLDVGYASALETLHTRHGDCTEYAVLLAAMARSQGIPTRIATGLIYADRFADASRMFVPHTWDQVWINDRWTSFDASMRQFDSTHIALGVGDGDPWRFFAVMDVLTNIRIDKAVAPSQPQSPPDRQQYDSMPSPGNTPSLHSPSVSSPNKPGAQASTSSA